MSKIAIRPSDEDAAMASECEGARFHARDKVSEESGKIW